MAMERVAFAVNPKAGQYKRPAHEGALNRVIKLYGPHHEIIGGNMRYYGLYADSREEWCECLKQMSSEADLVIFLGGDGTHKLVINNVPEHIPIGGIPRGHGNAYASDLNLPKSLILVAKKIMNGENHSIDTILYNNEQKVLFAGIGMNALITKRRTALSRNSGLIAYAISAVKPFIKYDTTAVDITVDGKKLPTIEKVVTLTITKLKYYGSDLLMVPQAELADGYVHLNVFTAGRGGIITGMLESKILRGFTGGNQLGQYLKGKEILIHTYKEQELHLNGTPEGSGTDFRFDIKPGSLIMRY